MSRGWIDINKVEENLQEAYKNLVEALETEDDNGIEINEALGHIAEALARVQGDAGSFDNQEGV